MIRALARAVELEKLQTKYLINNIDNTHNKYLLNLLYTINTYIIIGNGSNRNRLISKN